MVHKIHMHGAFNKFPDFFVLAFRIVVDAGKFSMLLLYMLWDDWPIFMISGSNEQLQQQMEYTLLKPDCHSWWISKMQSDTLEEQYEIKFCFKLGKNDAKETGGMLQTAFGASFNPRIQIINSLSHCLQVMSASLWLRKALCDIAVSPQTHDIQPVLLLC